MCCMWMCCGDAAGSSGCNTCPYGNAQPSFTSCTRWPADNAPQRLAWLAWRDNTPPQPPHLAPLVVLWPFRFIRLKRAPTLLFPIQVHGLRSLLSLQRTFCSEAGTARRLADILEPSTCFRQLTWSTAAVSGARLGLAAYSSASEDVRVVAFTALQRPFYPGACAPERVIWTVWLPPVCGEGRLVGGGSWSVNNVLEVVRVPPAVCSPHCWIRSAQLVELHWDRGTEHS